MLKWFGNEQDLSQKIDATLREKNLLIKEKLIIDLAGYPLTPRRQEIVREQMEIIYSNLDEYIALVLAIADDSERLHYLNKFSSLERFSSRLNAAQLQIITEATEQTRKNLEKEEDDHCIFKMDDI